MGNDSTILITDIHSVLDETEKAAEKKPAAFLVVGGDLNGAIFDLIDNEIVVGRSAENQIPLDFQGISRHHMKITQTNESHVLEDLGSRNGTFLNNKRIVEQIELQKGDIVKLGCIALKYIPQGDPERLTYDKLNLDANTDGLTGCYNKSYFNNAIDLEVKKSKVTGSPLSLIIFDLDHFKNLNDNFGHDAGDYVLKELALLIRGNGVRDRDIFARYGGEEFVILLPGTNLKLAYEIAERLRKLVEDHNFSYEDKRLPVTASIGVADYRQGVLTGTDLFRRADNAVYKAKDGGRNQVQFFKK
jgi:diguanylate cyclase (GGDEF)-like protein